MTLLIILAVIKGYVIIPWWAWFVGWLHGMWSLAVFLSATRSEYRKYKQTKMGETFIKDLMERIQTAVPSQAPFVIPDSSNDKSMN